MFNSCVLKMSVDTKKWIKAALIRAVKTMAQTALAAITVEATMSEIQWMVVGSAAVVAGIYSILTSVAGIPEVKPDTLQCPENEKHE